MSHIFVKTTPAFDCKASKLLTEEALEELFDYLANYPERGDLIQGTGVLENCDGKQGKIIKVKVEGQGYFIIIQKAYWC